MGTCKVPSRMKNKTEDKVATLYVLVGLFSIQNISKFLDNLFQ